MKAFIATFLLASAMWASPAPARTSSTSPLLGSWALDLSRMPVPPEARPKSVTITFSDAGGGKWSTEVHIVDGSGAESRAKSTYALDGTPVPVEGSIEADMTAVKMPVPDVLIMSLAKGGVPASTRIFTVAGDGNTQIETAVYFTTDGKPVMRTNYFTRVR
jgi:hypothetical protein